MKLTRNQNAENYLKQSKIALGGFFAELPNFIASFFICIFSNTLIVWMDFFNSFQSTMHYGIVFIMSRKLGKDLTDKYNYGVERVEVFTSFICDILISVGLVIMAIYSVINIFNPSAPSDNLLFFLILKVINIAFDIYFVIQQLYIRKKRTSRLADTELSNSVRYLLEDIITIVVAFICFLFRDFHAAWYISPVACIILSVYFFVNCVKRLKKSIDDLTDLALPIDIQDKLTDTLLTHNQIKRIYSVNCREINSITYIDIYVGFLDDISYKTQLELLDVISEEIKPMFSKCFVSFVIRPAKENS